MTARRYRPPTERGRIEDHAEALSALQFGNPLPTFRASISGNSTILRQYDDLSAFGAVGMDTVFWDYWDEGYDHRFFDPFIQPEGHPDAGRVGAVELLVNGLYAIRATIDWDDFFTIPSHSYLGSNYDDGGTDHWYLDGTWDVSPAFSINHFRNVWPAYTGSEAWVEIIAGHTDSTSHSIPGGIGGAWAMPPHLTIAYLGGLQTEPNYFIDT